MLAQKRSILPSVIGCCGRDTRCATRSLVSSTAKRLLPRQFMYWGPRSVSISFGGEYSPTATRYVSITAAPVGLRYNSRFTM